MDKDLNRIRLREAFEYANKNGKNITKAYLAGKMFTYTSKESAYVRFNSLERGSTTTIDRKTVNIICQHTGVTPNFLFGWDDNN